MENKMLRFRIYSRVFFHLPFSGLKHKDGIKIELVSSGQKIQRGLAFKFFISRERQDLWYQHEQLFSHLLKLPYRIYSISCILAAIEKRFSAAGVVVNQR